MPAPRQKNAGKNARATRKNAGRNARATPKQNGRADPLPFS